MTILGTNIQLMTDTWMSKQPYRGRINKHHSSNRSTLCYTLHGYTPMLCRIHNANISKDFNFTRHPMWFWRWGMGLKRHLVLSGAIDLWLWGLQLLRLGTRGCLEIWGLGLGAFGTFWAQSFQCFRQFWRLLLFKLGAFCAFGFWCWELWGSDTFEAYDKLCISVNLVTSMYALPMYQYKYLPKKYPFFIACIFALKRLHIYLQYRIVYPQALSPVFIHLRLVSYCIPVRVLDVYLSEYWVYVYLCAI